MSKRHSVNVYDFDHTIYHGDASLDFIVYCLLRMPRLWKYTPHQALAAVRFISRSWSRKQFKEAVFSFLRDIPDIDTTVDAFWMKNKRKIKPWYVQQREATDIVISASPEFLLAPITKTLSARTLLATKMDKHTGKIAGENCRGEEKVRRLRAYDSTLQVGSFYSDSLSDMPLLKLAEHPFIVKGDTITSYVDSSPH